MAKRKAKTKRKPIGPPFGWDALSDEEKDAFGIPSPADIEEAKSREVGEIKKLNGAKLEG